MKPVGRSRSIQPETGLLGFLSLLVCWVASLKGGSTHTKKLMDTLGGQGPIANEDEV